MEFEKSELRSVLTYQELCDIFKAERMRILLHQIKLDIQEFAEIKDESLGEEKIESIADSIIDSIVFHKELNRIKPESSEIILDEESNSESELYVENDYISEMQNDPHRLIAEFLGNAKIQHWKDYNIYKCDENNKLSDNNFSNEVNTHNDLKKMSKLEKVERIDFSDNDSNDGNTNHPYTIINSNPNASVNIRVTEIEEESLFCPDFFDQMLTYKADSVDSAPSKPNIQDLINRFNSNNPQNSNMNMLNNKDCTESLNGFKATQFEKPKRESLSSNVKNSVKDLVGFFESKSKVLK